MTQGEYPGSEAMYVNEQRVFIDAVPRDAIVIHKTAGFSTAQEVANYFATTPEETSAHFVIGLDGVIIQVVRLKDGAAANCCIIDSSSVRHDSYWDNFNGQNLNLFTISIEHVDPATDNSTPVTQQQKDASFKLVKWLCDQFNIKHIMTHASIDPRDRSRCPGNYPMQELIDYALGGNTVGVPKGWKDDANKATLTAPNGNTVVKGFRDFILANRWDPGDIPLAEEQVKDPIEDGSGKSEAGSIQIFMYTELAWTTNRGVFKVTVGRELFAELEKVVSLHQQIQTLNQELAAAKNGGNKALYNSTLSACRNLENQLIQLGGV